MPNTNITGGNALTSDVIVFKCLSHLFLAIVSHARHLVTSGSAGHAHRQNSFVLVFLGRHPPPPLDRHRSNKCPSTDRPPAKADISLFGDRLLRGHSPIEMNNTSDAMSSEKLSF